MSPHHKITWFRRDGLQDLLRGASFVILIVVLVWGGAELLKREISREKRLDAQDHRINDLQGVVRTLLAQRLGAPTDQPLTVIVPAEAGSREPDRIVTIPISPSTTTHPAPTTTTPASPQTTTSTAPPPQSTTTTTTTTLLPLPTLPISSTKKGQSPMDFVPIVAALALASKVVDFIKYLANFSEYRSSIVAQLSVWVAGVTVVFLLAESDFANGVTVADLTLSGLNAFSLILFGLSLGSTGSVVYDFKKARDNTDSAETPPMLPQG